jgi:hypothetical protein
MVFKPPAIVIGHDQIKQQTPKNRQETLATQPKAQWGPIQTGQTSCLVTSMETVPMATLVLIKSWRKRGGVQ